jgi:hypothetical protein
MRSEKQRLKILVTLLAGAMALAVLSCLLPSQADAQTRGGAGQVRPATGSSWSVTPSDYNGTLFGRQRVAVSYNLTDVINTYGFDPEVWGSRGDGGITSLTNEAALLLTAPSDGGFITIETHNKYRYQAGHAQLILQTATIPTVLDVGVQGLYRFGYYDDGDGLFWQTDTRTASPTYGLGFVRRTSTDGGVTDNWTAVSSSLTTPVNLINGNIFETRFAWLGIHEADGYINGVKRFMENFDGRLPVVYMKTAFLPLRAEVAGVGAQLKYICSSVQSEGGQEPPGIGFSVVRPTAKSITSGAGILPVIAVRPATTFGGQPSRVQSFPTSVTCAADNATTRVYAVLNPTTLTGASWAAVDPNSAMQVDVAATAYVGGTVVDIMGGSSSAPTEKNLSHVFNELGRRLKVRAFGASQDVLLIAVDTLTGTASSSCSVSWNEVR